MSPKAQPAPPRRTPTTGRTGTPAATNATRRDAARQKARALREAEARRARRNRVTLISVAIVAVLVVVAVVAFAVSRSSGGEAGAARPPGITSNDGVVTGSASAKHTITIYQDYQCPYCKNFETTVGPWLEQQRQASTTRVEYRIVSFLDRLSSGSRYSSRAANAAACVAGEKSADYSAFNDALYAQQPAEGGDGLPDATLISVAKKAGAGSGVASCISDDRYADWVKSASDAATSKHHVTGTPTVLVDGKVIADPTQQALATALGVTG